MEQEPIRTHGLCQIYDGSEHGSREFVGFGIGHDEEDKGRYEGILRLQEQIMRHLGWSGILWSLLPQDQGGRSLLPQDQGGRSLLPQGQGCRSKFLF